MRRRAVISLTPLIDVVFILLVFFMLASSFMEWRTLDLNAARAGGAGDMQGALLLEIRKEGIRLSGREINPSALAGALHPYFVSDPDQRVLVKPADGVPLQAAIDTLDQIAAAGGRNATLVGAGGR